jgi:methylthioribose-1-phosphate isomerase
LPAEEIYVTTEDWRVIADAIRRLAIRGAPAIGVAAAMGVALAAKASSASGPADARAGVAAAIDGLGATRPTAVNLFWALDRMRRVAARAELPPAELARVLEAEAEAIHVEDLAMSREIGQHGAELVQEGARVLTHCNAGGLATGGLGTALAVLYAAQAAGKHFEVLVDETRPLLQGARLTAWELTRAGIPATLITDSMAGAAMARLGVDLVVVGADRIAQNGDTANKIGTYGLALLAQAHAVPFVVAAPTSTIDPALATGAQIPIEERAPAEVRSLGGLVTAPAGVQVWNPAFDVTPGRLVAAIVTETGVIRPPYPGRLVQPTALAPMAQKAD